MLVSAVEAQLGSHTAVLFPAALRSWNVELSEEDLNRELQLFKTCHTAQFSSQVKGQFSLEDKKKEEVVLDLANNLINPTSFDLECAFFLPK